MSKIGDLAYEYTQKYKRSYYDEIDIGDAYKSGYMQAQTPWMRGKKMAAHTGFIVLDFDVKDGCVCNLSVKLYPFYT